MAAYIPWFIKPVAGKNIFHQNLNIIIVLVKPVAKLADPGFIRLIIYKIAINFGSDKMGGLSLFQ